MSKITKTRQQVANIEEDPVTGPHWVLRLPVQGQYDVATAARILGTSRAVLKQRINAGKLKVTPDGRISHPVIVKEVKHRARRAVGRRYRQQLINVLQRDLRKQ